MADSDTRSVFAISNLLRNFVFVTVIAEKPASHRYVVGKGSNVFSAFTAISGYSAFAFIQKAGREDVCSNMVLRPPSFASSINWSSSWTDRLLVSVVANGLRIHAFVLTRIFGGWEVAVKFLRQRNQVITDQLRQSWSWLSSSQYPH